MTNNHTQNPIFEFYSFDMRAHVWEMLPIPLFFLFAALWFTIFEEWNSYSLTFLSFKIDVQHKMKRGSTREPKKKKKLNVMRQREEEWKHEEKKVVAQLCQYILKWEKKGEKICCKSFHRRKSLQVKWWNCILNLLSSRLIITPAFFFSF